MKNYESWLVKYATYINDLEDILSEEDWQKRLNEIAEDIFLAYEYRKDLREYNEDLKKLDERLLKIGEKLKKLHPPAYEYFEKFFKEVFFKIELTKKLMPLLERFHLLSSTIRRIDII